MTPRLVVLWLFDLWLFVGLIENLNLERKFLSGKDRKDHPLLFEHSFETKIGFGYGLASYLEVQIGADSSQTNTLLKEVAQEDCISSTSLDVSLHTCET